uniref:Uncharacterized protein n=1 Tax=Rhipicephalus zambeziensis TaxID=60191 RepID=A0A224YF98_9ACAR
MGMGIVELYERETSITKQKQNEAWQVTILASNINYSLQCKKREFFNNRSTKSPKRKLQKWHHTSRSTIHLHKLLQTFTLRSTCLCTIKKGFQFSSLSLKGY